MRPRWWEQAIRDHATEHGPSGESWNISAILDRLREAEPERSDRDIAVGEHAFLGGFSACLENIHDLDTWSGSIPLAGSIEHMQSAHNAWNDYDPPEDLKGG